MDCKKCKSIVDEGLRAQVADLKINLEEANSDAEAWRRQADGFAKDVDDLKAKLEERENSIRRIIKAGRLYARKHRATERALAMAIASNRENFDEKEKVEAQVQRLKSMSTIEMMCENPSVDAHVREWEARCLKAETLVQAQADVLSKAREAFIEIRNKGDWQSKYTETESYSAGYATAWIEARGIALKALSSLQSPSLEQARLRQEVVDAAKELVDCDGWATGRTLDRLITAFAKLEASK
jgi:hypothetical protein